MSEYVNKNYAPFRVAVTEIKEKIIELFKNDERLQHVEEIQLFSRRRGIPRPPTMWIFPRRITKQTENMSIRQEWNYPISIVTVVRNSDIQKASQQVDNIALSVKEILEESNNLGLGYIKKIDVRELEESTENVNNPKTEVASEVVVDIIFSSLK